MMYTNNALISVQNYLQILDIFFSSGLEKNLKGKNMHDAFLVEMDTLVQPFFAEIENIRMKYYCKKRKNAHITLHAALQNIFY